MNPTSRPASDGFDTTGDVPSPGTKPGDMFCDWADSMLVGMFSVLPSMLFEGKPIVVFSGLLERLETELASVFMLFIPPRALVMLPSEPPAALPMGALIGVCIALLMGIVMAPFMGAVMPSSPKEPPTIAFFIGAATAPVHGTGSRGVALTKPIDAGSMVTAGATVGIFTIPRVLDP